MRCSCAKAILATGLVALMGAVAQAEPPTRILRIGTDATYPPYEFTSPAGAIAGFEPDLIMNLCERMKERCELTSLDWSGLIPKLQSGDVDLIAAALSITPERRAVIDFSLPYYSAPTYFIARKHSPIVYPDAGRIIDLADPDDHDRRLLDELGRHLKQAVVGVEGSTTHEAVVRHCFPNVGRIRVYPTQDGLFLDLVIGRVDAVFVGYGNAHRFIARQEATGRDFVLFGPGMRGGLLGEGVAFGLRKGNVGLQRRLDEALRAAQRDGTVSKLSLRWFGIDASVRYDTPSQ